MEVELLELGLGAEGVVEGQPGVLVVRVLEVEVGLISQ